MKDNFFPRPAMANFFLFYNLDTHGILQLFELIANFRMKDQLWQKFFLFYNLATHGILHTEFGSLSTTLRPNQKDLFLKLLI